MFSEESQDVIDALLGQACPDWTLPPRVADEDDQRRYERIEATRLRVGVPPRPGTFDTVEDLWPRF